MDGLLVEITERASAGAARVAAGTAGARGGGRVTRTFGRHGKDAKLRAQFLALTLGALRFVAAEKQGFKLEMTFLADVFKNRHDESLPHHSLFPLESLQVDFANVRW